MDCKVEISTKKKNKYWYKMYVGECPVCGKDKSYRERIAGEKPENVEERYIYLPDTYTYDGCLGV